MKHLFKVAIFTLIILSLFSCKKEDDLTVDETTDTTVDQTDDGNTVNVVLQGKNYYPTTVNTLYTYDSPSYSTYTVEFTGTEDFEGLEYATIKTTVNGSSSYSKARSTSEEVMVVSGVGGLSVDDLKLKLIDFTKELNEPWVAGTVEVVNSSTVTTTTYTGELTGLLSTHTVNGVTYDDVLEVTLTTKPVYSLSQAYIDLVGEEFAELMQQNLNASNIEYVQKTYYANNIGMIQQVSDDQPSLNVDLESKNF